MPKYRFVYTTHVEYQMFNRSISKSQIEQTVTRPDKTADDDRDPEVTVAIREFTPGTFLKVWYRLENGQSTLVSCILITVRRERPDAKKPTRKATKRRKQGKRR